MTTTLAYDAGGRLLSRQYSDGMPSVTMAYDGTSLPCAGEAHPRGWVPANDNLIGRRSAMCDASGSTTWKYDVMGRVVVERQRRTVGGSYVEHSIGYSYSPSGRATRLGFVDGTGPAEGLIDFDPDAAERITGVCSARYYHLAGATYDVAGAVVGGSGGWYFGPSGYTHLGSITGGLTGGLDNQCSSKSTGLCPLQRT